MPNFARTAKNTAAVLATSAEVAAVVSEKAAKAIRKAIAKQEAIRKRAEAAEAARAAWDPSSFVPFGSIGCQDAIEGMREWKNNSVDAVITDPPYGVLMAKWDAKVPSVNVWREALRVLRPGGYCVVAAAPRTYHQTAAALEAAGFLVRDMLIWQYSQSFPGAQALGGEWRSNLKTNQEPWVVAQKPLEKGLTLRDNWRIWGVGGVRTGATGQPGWRTNVISCPKPKAKERDLGLIPGKFYAIPGSVNTGAWQNSRRCVNRHPTVKPLALMRRIVRTFSPDYGSVLDPFMGSGSTLIAAAVEGREVFGTDLDYGYWDMACDRVSWAYANPHLVPPAA